MPSRFLEIPVFLGDYFLCRTLYIVCVINEIPVTRRCVRADNITQSYVAQTNNVTLSKVTASQYQELFRYNCS